MSDTLTLACPSCHTLNRVPRARLEQAPNCGRCHQALFQAHPVALDALAFERHVSSSELPVVVDFWAEWCGPCRMMAPHFEAAAQRLEPAVRLAKLDTDGEAAVAGRFNIRSIPTLILFRHGREIARQAGALGAADIERWVRQHLA